MKIVRSTLAAALLGVLGAGTAGAVPVGFTKLTGVTGGTIAATAVYKADLGALGFQIASISIDDASAGLGGAPGQFSGFDLDAIKLSTTNCADAACAAAAAGLAVFNFGGGTFFTPGAQRAPADPKLFGTGPAGNTVDNAVARLGLFDGESTTAIPGAEGFMSMGDGGRLAFNLTALTDPTGLFLYIGEVGDNGEVAASNIQVRNTRVPEPGVLSLLGLGVCSLLGLRRRLCA
ncbi:MAG: PEP-CTERM sorting domain-containing protein [Rhodocyclaceae bacterium]|nr:PEP-CTERM sorting domain-containing protein [Rhodocyclaceae bacterium]MBX3669171.1 PEP-CTERM sorting domain-containing protein [Rhodocyclaceae bacterium]